MRPLPRVLVAGPARAHGARTRLTGRAHGARPRFAGAARVMVAAALALSAAGLGAAATVATAPAAAAATCPAAGGATIPRAKTPTGDVVFRGGGWGHGLGMSQYGAQGAARLGCTASQILTRYYTGARVVAAPMPTSISLRMLDKGDQANITAMTADVTWELESCIPGLIGPTGMPDCAPAQPKGATWQLRLDSTGAQYALWDLGATPKTLVWQGGHPDQELRLRHNGSVVRLVTAKGSSTYLDRQLRWGFTRFTLATPGQQTGRLDAVQVLEDDANGSAMDKYLWGIAEVPASFPAEALKAQAIAARTYAAKRAGRVLMPTPADQNYTGYAKESEGTNGVWGARWRAAVDATSGRVLASTSTGDLVDTFYSSSVGGYTEDERYVWGVASPFLRAVDDSRWDLASSNPAARRAWAVGFSWSTLANRLGFQSLTNISVPKRGTSARLAGVKVTGFRAGALVTSYLTGWDVRQALGLLSPGLEISIQNIGGPSATPIVGDWDGDGRDEPGWFRRGQVALLMTDANGTWVKRYRFGRSGDLPVVGDWDGNGVDSVGVFRAGTWFLRNDQSGGAADRSFAYGAAGDRPVAGRWTTGSPSDANPKVPGIGVVRAGVWMLRTTPTAGAPEKTFRFGRAKDVPLVGDWDGDGATSVGVRRGQRWLLRDTTSGGPATRSFIFGRVTDRPVVGDWDGNGTTSAGVARARTFYLRDGAGGGKASATVPFSG
ncbi:MAG: SpoIID/LytB domain-containing protein [Actinomycetes bacterium]